MDERHIYTVGQVNSYVKSMVEQDFALRSIRVSGEVSNCTYHGSGHIYFNLKDKTGVLKAVMFSGKVKSGLRFRLSDGQSVVVTGRLSVYERGGYYQIYADKIEPAGIGDLYQQYEKLKRELEAMGIFAQGKKKKIPKYSFRIGVCTAETGAAIRDIINVSHRRNPYVQLYLYPALVQGKAAAADIVRGIKILDSMQLDVIIIGRGGGSIEDLWAFNERDVALALYQCKTPVISAVGHETDTTISDYAADLRAPTPSAAAELAVFDYKQFQDLVGTQSGRLLFTLQAVLNRKRSQCQNYEVLIRKKSPESILAGHKQYTSELNMKLDELMSVRLTERKHKLGILAERLKGLSPLDKISGGYAYVTRNDKPVLSIEMLENGSEVDLRFRDGVAMAEIKDVDLDDTNMRFV